MNKKVSALDEFRNGQKTIDELTIEIEVERKSLGIIFKNQPDGERALKHLEEIFAANTVAYDANGAVDQGGTMVATGQRQVVDYIKECIEDAS